MTPSNVEPPDDYEELIASLNARGVEFVIIGAYAVGYHGYIRATNDVSPGREARSGLKPRFGGADRAIAGFSWPRGSEWIET